MSTEFDTNEDDVAFEFAFRRSEQALKQRIGTFFNSLSHVIVIGPSFFDFEATQKVTLSPDHFVEIIFQD